MHVVLVHAIVAGQPCGNSVLSTLRKILLRRVLRNRQVTNPSAEKKEFETRNDHVGAISKGAGIGSMPRNRYVGTEERLSGFAA